MRLLIVGVGQTINFETKQMEDVLQVMAPDGSVFSVPTSNEAAQGIVKLAMNGNGHQEDPFIKAVEEMPRETMRVWQTESGHTAYDPTGEVVPDSVEIAGERAVEGFPEGAEIFGEEGTASASEAARIFARTQRTKSSKSSLGMTRNNPDRSGVPSYGISRVDERGNPILPEAPDFVDDEDDPGEQA